MKLAFQHRFAILGTAAEFREARDIYTLLNEKDGIQF